MLEFSRLGEETGRLVAEGVQFRPESVVAFCSVQVQRQPMFHEVKGTLVDRVGYVTECQPVMGFRPTCDLYASGEAMVLHLV